MRKKRSLEMTPAQKDVYLVIDEWWKKFGFGPTIDEVMLVMGVTGRGNVARKMRTLVELGVCKGIPRRARSIRPAYLKVRDIV
jgi:SOS-response transcriptional repressor LexA